MSRCVWLVVASTSLAVVGVVWWWVSPNYSNRSDRTIPAVLNCPREIDLGTVEIHRSIEGVLPIANTGGQPLTIRDITTSCGCLGARLLPKREELKSSATVTIPPGGHIEIAFPLRVSGVHGVKSGHVIRFQTDAPDTPTVEVRLTFTPTARYFTDPGTLSFGDIAEGDVLPTALVGLFSTDGHDTPSVSAVASSDPERVRVSFVPESAGAVLVAAEAAPGSRRFGQVRVELVGLKPGDAVNAQVQVATEGHGDVLVVPVSAHLVRPIELTPAVLYLPRSSSSGPIYSGAVVCRATGVEALSLTIGALPAGLTATVEASPNTPGFVRLTVTADPKSAARESVVPLTARRGDRDHPLVLRVVTDPTP